MSNVRPLPQLISGAIATAGARVLRSRWLMRAPIWLYRARLGFLLGTRMLLLEHIGRQSGIRRSVVLEVFDHPSPNTYVVVSGFGTRAQWFRNVRANPQVQVSVGGHVSTPATARILTPPQADASLQAYAARHPRAWHTFKPVLEATLGAAISDRDTELPMIELRLSPGRAPAPQPSSGPSANTSKPFLRTTGPHVSRQH
jgi:deazaflavin-dependent oxidoreductase (nitroreductase family)